MDLRTIKAECALCGVRIKQTAGRIPLVDNGGPRRFAHTSCVVLRIYDLEEDHRELVAQITALRASVDRLTRTNAKLTRERDAVKGSE